MIILKSYWEAEVGGIALVKRIKKPEDRSCKNAEHYGLPVSFIEA